MIIIDILRELVKDKSVDVLGSVIRSRLSGGVSRLMRINGQDVITGVGVFGTGALDKDETRFYSVEAVKKMLPKKAKKDEEENTEGFDLTSCEVFEEELEALFKERFDGINKAGLIIQMSYERYGE